ARGRGPSLARCARTASGWDQRRGWCAKLRWRERSDILLSPHMAYPDLTLSGRNECVGQMRPKLRPKGTGTDPFQGVFVSWGFTQAASAEGRGARIPQNLGEFPRSPGNRSFGDGGIAHVKAGAAGRETIGGKRTDMDAARRSSGGECLVICLIGQVGRKLQAAFARCGAEIGRKFVLECVEQRGASFRVAPSHAPDMAAEMPFADEISK